MDTNYEMTEEAEVGEILRHSAPVISTKDLAENLVTNTTEPQTIPIEVDTTDSSNGLEDIIVVKDEIYDSATAVKRKLPYSNEVKNKHSQQSDIKRKKKIKVKNIFEPLELEAGVDIDINYDDPSMCGATENVEPAVQSCRAELRERYLWAVMDLMGKTMDVDMLENLKVSGVLRGVDKDGLVVNIKDLRTPTVTFPWSALRLPDCLALKFPASKH